MSVQEILTELPKLEPHDLRLVRERTIELESASRTPKSSWGKALMEIAGTAKGLPSDLARNHDHYLYGTPKQS